MSLRRVLVADVLVVFVAGAVLTSPDPYSQVRFAAIGLAVVVPASLLFVRAGGDEWVAARL